MPAETILVVDDARAIRDFLAEVVLRPSGYTVLLAENGAEALETAARAHPHLIISDIKMPGVTGLDLARAVQHEWPDLPVILITAEGSEEIAQQALRAGVVDYFVKPFDPDELLQTVRRALARQSEAAEAAQARRLPALLEAVADGVAVMDSSQRLILLNQAGRALLGMERVDVAGRPLAEVAPPAELLDLLNSGRRTGEIRLADGRVVSVVATPLGGAGRLVLLQAAAPAATDSH
ncbi:MAG: response regulator [Anaerolineales bacterium]|nr:response regulator [Anaerolineales bacterium]